jgi:hypothetical protein
MLLFTLLPSSSYAHIYSHTLICKHKQTERCNRDYIMTLDLAFLSLYRITRLICPCMCLGLGQARVSSGNVTKQPDVSQSPSDTVLYTARGCSVNISTSAHKGEIQWSDHDQDLLRFDCWLHLYVDSGRYIVAHTFTPGRRNKLCWLTESMFTSIMNVLTRIFRMKWQFSSVFNTLIIKCYIRLTTSCTSI